MAKYKLTVKYDGVCDLSIAGDIPDIIGNEFDQYVKSMLYKKEEWENFETNFKEAAKREYGRLNREKNKEQTPKATIDTQEENIENPCIEPVSEEETSNTVTEYADDAPVLIEKENEPLEEITDTKNTTQPKQPEIAQPETTTVLTFEEYTKNKNIKTPLDEFVAGACYLDEILDIKEFTLKDINSKLYPVFNRLAGSDIINTAIKRVLIEKIKEGDKTKYSINENAWNYHNYDLVKH